MVRLLRWLGFLVSIALRAILGASGTSGGGGGGGFTADEYSIDTLGTATSFSSTTQYGWELLVGPSDLTVGELRLYAPSTGTITLRLWRISDETLLAEEDVSAVADTWVTASLASTVALSNGAKYAITAREASGASVSLYGASDTTGFAFGEAIQFEQRRSITGSDAFPSSTASSGPYGITDIGYEIDTPSALTGPYRYFRLYITNFTGASYISVAELELRTSVGGADQTGSGTSSTSSVAFAGFEASKAFDDDDATQWLGNSSAPQWLQYDMGSGNDISLAQYAITASPDSASSRSPEDWVLQASHDGTFWFDLDTVSGETGWTNGEQRVFTV